MKYINSKRISREKYLITLEVSDYDLEMLEDLVTTYAPFKFYEKNVCDFTSKYQYWLLRMWKTFTTLWKRYDKT